MRDPDNSFRVRQAIDQRLGQRNPLNRLPPWLPATVLALAVVLVLGFEVWRSHETTRADAERSSQTLVRVLAEQTERTFQSVEVSLASIAEELQTQPRMPDNDPEFRARLRDRLHELPYVRAFFIVGADGFISHDTDYPSTPHVSLADRPYFTFHQTNPSTASHIGQPLLSRSVGVWFISLTQRLNSSDGKFAGVAVAAVEPLYCEKFYREVWVGSGAISLFLDDGTLLARAPQVDNAIGHSFASTDLFQNQLPHGDTGMSWGASPLDGIRRLAAYRRVDDNLVMLVTMNEDDVMRPWKDHALFSIGSAVVLLAVIGAMELLLARFRQREARAKALLDRAQRLEATGRFAAGIAHDFGNVVRVVRSSVTLLRPMLAGNQEAENILLATSQAVEASRAMIDQLLLFAGNRELSPQPSNLDELVAAGLPIFRQAAGPLTSVVERLSGTRASCLIDRAQFNAAILNLVINASQATSKGGSIWINVDEIETTEGALPKRWITVAVNDHGQGMSSDTLTYAFDPFFTTKEEGKGTGLGLSQVYGFVKRSGGEIDISSTELGTSIELRFPIADGGPAQVFT